MKHLLITTIAAVVLVGCGESQQSAPSPESKPVEPVAEVPVQPSPPPVEAKPAEPVAEAAKPTTPPKAVSANKGADPARGINPKPPTTKAPDISIHDAAYDGNIEDIKQQIAAGADVNENDEKGATPLHGAAFTGRMEVVELLIANGADVNAKDKERQPHQRSASIFKSTECTRHAWARFSICPCLMHSLMAVMAGMSLNAGPSATTQSQLRLLRRGCTGC